MQYDRESQPEPDFDPGGELEPGSEPVELTVQPGESGMRLDALLAQHFTRYSRVHLRKVISAGGVTVDQVPSKPSLRLKPGQTIRMVLPELPRQSPEPENIPLDVLYEDEAVIAVNKPPGMVVHPSRGHWSGTLAGALQYHFNELSTIGGPTRPGIVHRLDRDTSGVILIARNDQAHAALSAQFAERTVEKEYLALTVGVPDRDRDFIDEPIGHHPHQRDKMAIRRSDPAARAARTFYEVLERLVGYSLIRLLPKTGRTHQLRVHLDHIGCSVLCDRLYGGRARITRGELRKDVQRPGIQAAGGEDADEVLLDRQALHAERLAFTHPTRGDRLEVHAPLPADMSKTLDSLRERRPIV